jgi:hypothetical protein
MTIELNTPAVKHARRLIKAGKVVRDERDDWSEDALAAADETDWLRVHGWHDFAEWHLGVDRDKNDETKGAYSFPMGDYSKVHRCAIISMESRAAQYDHPEIAKAAKKLLEQIDKGATTKKETTR